MFHFMFAPYRVLTACTLLVLSIPLIGAAQGNEAARGNGKNVVVILIDALRFDGLGINGYGKETSPFIDSLFSKGVVFERAYAQAPQTLISTASLLSGQYYPVWKEIEEDLKKPYYRQKLGVPNVTIADELRQAGYQTMAVLTNPHHHPQSGFAQGFDSYLYLQEEKSYARGAKVNQAFYDWYATRDENKPFFAYLHFMDVHSPYRPLEEYKKLFVEEEGRDLYMNGKPEGDAVPSEQDLKYMRALYDGEMRYVDSVLEALWAFLSEHSQNENTILILASDHGEEFMEHDGLGHGHSQEIELLHVPLLMYGLPEMNAGRVGKVVRNIDIAPTITDALVLAAPEHWDGVSLLHTGPSTAPAPYSQDKNRSYAHHTARRSITNQRWHFIADLGGDDDKLYDLSSDPKGLVNLIDSLPRAVASLRETMLRTVEGSMKSTALLSFVTGQAPGEAAEEDVDFDALQEQMEALGYLD